MKTGFVSFLAFAVISSPALGQLHLGTGESYRAAFSIEDFNGPVRGAVGPFEPNWLYVTMSPESISSANVLRVEAGSFIDEFKTDAPTYRLYGYSFAAPTYVYPDVVQITVLAGNVTLTQIDVTLYGNRVGNMVDIYTLKFVPVPEPNTWALVGLAGLAAMVCRIKSRVVCRAGEQRC